MSEAQNSNYNIEPPQEELIEESLEAGVSIQEASDLSGVPSYEVKRYADEKGIDYSIVGETSPEEFHDWDDRLNTESIGKLINSYLKEWKAPEEYRDDPQDRLSEHHSKKILSDLGLEIGEEDSRPEPEERVVNQYSDVLEYRAFEPERIQRKLINGDYVVKNELGIEDYIKAMRGDAKDSRVMADTIMDLTGLERDGLAEEIMDFRLMEGGEPGRPFVVTDRDIDWQESDNLRRMISQVHEDFEEVLEENKSKWE